MTYAIIIAVLFAIYEAHRDERITPVHGWAFWLRRAAIFSGLVVALSFAVDACIVSMLIAGAAAFAIAHRATYNWLRHQPWDYISRSNGYDRALLFAFGKWGGVAAYVGEAAVIYLAT